MRVIEAVGFGGPEVLAVREAPDPVPGPGQVVVDVSVVDVMSLDAQLRTGWGKEWFGHEPPYVPGTGVAGYAGGRRVAARVGGGGYAEKVVASEVAAVPDGLSLPAAAALLQVGPAALSLVDAAELKPGTRVLVTGAGGALGLALVQLAAAAGAEVTGAARGAGKRSAARAAGAARVVDYAEVTGEFDVVFDGVGGQVGAELFERVAPGGTFFAYGVTGGYPAQVDPAGRRVVGMEQVQFAPEEFVRLAERAFAEAVAGGLRPHVGLAVPFDQVARAHAALDARELTGKALLLVTSRAALYSAYGGPEVLRVDELPIPEPGPGQVRLAVQAAGVNAIDWKFRQGMMGGPLEGPAGTGIEVAGTVDALGPGVAGPQIGQAVFGRVLAGGVADFVLADPADLVERPDWLAPEEAAALPVAAGTAHRVLGLLGLRPGQTLLIHAVAGGVGLAAAQLAIARGARVIGTASERHHGFLRSLGVEPVVYGDGLEERITEPVDLVLDASGRDVLGLSVRLTGDPAKVVTIADGRTAAEHGVRFSTGSQGGAPLGEVFAEVLPLAERGALRIPVAAAFPLERIADAHRMSEDGHFLGKIVIVAE